MILFILAWFVSRVESKIDFFHGQSWILLFFKGYRSSKARHSQTHKRISCRQSDLGSSRSMVFRNIGLQKSPGGGRGGPRGPRPITREGVKCLVWLQNTTTNSTSGNAKRKLKKQKHELGVANMDTPILDRQLRNNRIQYWSPWTMGRSNTKMLCQIQAISG